MVFTSLEFLFLFLPLSILLHAAAPERCRNGVLLLLSVLFLIGGGLPRLGLFLAMLLCSYGCGLFLERCKGKHVLCGVLLILLFLLHGVLLAVLRPSSYSSAVAAWLYPLGISYLALQGIGYCLDIAKGSIPAEHRLLSFATYYLFYPKVLMGPVVSYADWKQILSEKQCDVPQIGAGLRLLVLGLGKKLLLANSAGLLHEVVQQSAGSERSMLAAWLSVLSFAAQLWLEGAAYSDMACGLASCYGLRLPENFGPLVLSKTVTDWVRNWNCTVVQWFHRSMYLPVSTKHWYGIAGQTIWIWLWIGVWCGNGVQFRMRHLDGDLYDIGISAATKNAALVSKCTAYLDGCMAFGRCDFATGLQSSGFTGKSYGTVWKRTTDSGAGSIFAVQRRIGIGCCTGTFDGTAKVEYGSSSL